ncbi:hypothetical protein FACS1894132_07040 [Clostridia bacterium]|nr:hypothetical protein FACS1894132_07040 [Clostridia bacterium]
MKKTLINWLGLLGIISFLSYTAAVIFSPLKYPNYDWKSGAVSDLSAANAPSLTLWNQLNSLYGVCGIVCCTLVCVFIKDKLNKTTRLGIYFFTIMNWISSVGYTIFPLSNSGYAGTFQDVMHVYVVTVAVVILSIASLILIMIGGYKKRQHVPLAICATIAFALMLIGAIGTGVAPKTVFGIFERFSVFSAAGFNAVLGVYLLIVKS